MVEVVKIMRTSFKRPHARTATLSAPTSAAGHCWPMPLPESPDTPGQVWVSLLWGHCSFFMGPGVHKVLFMPSKNLFPQSCVSSGGSVVGLMATSSKWAYAIPRSTAPRALAPEVHCWPAPPQEVKHHSVSVSLGFFLGGWIIVAVGGRGPKSLQMVTAAMKLKDTCSLEEKLWPT